MTSTLVDPASTSEAPANFVALLRKLAVERPQETWLTVAVMAEGKAIERSHTFAAFDRRVQALAAALQEHCDVGSRALVMLDNDEHYAASMLACFYAGVIAVPVPPWDYNRSVTMQRVAGIARDSGAVCLLTSAEAVDALQGDDTLPSMIQIVADRIALDGADRWRPREPMPEDVAFLQYTSGSTSEPKGVMVTHANLMANQRVIQEKMGADPTDIMVSWAPLYHDMGLIGGLLQPLFAGRPLVLCSPRYFLENPARWLALISKHSATVSGGPDFSYRLCVDRIKKSQLAGLDLSCWRLAYSGAEPVRAQTMALFAERFASVGFKAQSSYPCYGLAEATLVVTGGELDAGVITREDGEALVSCGWPARDHRVAIIDPVSLRERVPGEVGEIWVSGPSICAGYWNREEQTQETFVERDGVRWLRTGDLGVLHGKALHVAGRIKDIIILHGHNIYPQDIEHQIENAVEAVRRGRVAAFAVPGENGEAIGIAAEVSRVMQNKLTPDELVGMVSDAVARAAGEAPAVVVLLNGGALPKTSSGKLQRQACRRGWAERSLDSYAIWEDGAFIDAEQQAETGAAPEGEFEVHLARAWASVLPGRALHRDSNFFRDGGDSLSALKLVALVAEAGFDIAPAKIFEHQTLRAIAAAGSSAAETLIARIPDAQRSQALPLSNAQARQWFLWQLNPASSAYHISGALHFRGCLNQQAVEAAFQALVARHESLRTVFRPNAVGEPQQWILPALAVQATEARVKDLAEPLRLIHETPFDLANGPLLRVTILRHEKEGQEHSTLAIVIHHIVSDGWSVQRLIEEFCIFYRLAMDGKPLDGVLPGLPVQYADYVLWQRAWLEEGRSVSQLDWWRSALGDDHQVLELPVDHPRRVGMPYRAARLRLDVPQDLSARLQDGGRKGQTTLFVVLLAAFQALLHRYTRQNDIRIGAAVTNRHARQTDGVIGFFVNAQVLRAQLDDAMSLRDVLHQTREFWQGAQANRDLPFEALVAALQPGRDLNHSPLFSVVINHLKIDYSGLNGLPGLEFIGLDAGEQNARFELTLDTAELPDGSLQVQFIYAEELFDRVSIERMANYYLRLLQAFAFDEEMAVGAILLHDETERSKLADAARPLIVSRPAGLLLHQRFETCARLRPDALALVDGGERLTYAQVNARANRIAHVLIAEKIGLEARVGLMAGRSVQLVIGILGILKAGAAYVPLDPAYPQERLSYMAQTSGISALLIGDGLDALPGLPEEVRRLSLSRAIAEGARDDDPGLPQHEDALAYVIFTSGSTGRPKGAQLTHANVARLLTMTDEWFHFGPEDVWTLFHSYAFDFSVWEIFGALCTGGALVIVSFEISRSPEEFALLLRDEDVTVLNQTPSAFRQLMAARALINLSLPALRMAIFGGEALDPAELAPWIERYGDSSPQLINMYGITETTVHVTYRRIMREDLTRKVSPIGSAIKDLGLYVLDSQLDIAAVNLPGELHVSGAGLSRGYLGRAALTAERFIANPFGADGDRLYRTGDLARRRPNGEIEYLGRIDAQVKLRGFRIEPGEIAAALRDYPQVQEAAVVLCEVCGDQQLAAYVVPDMDYLRANRAAPQGLVEQWETVFDSAYDSQGVAPSFRGWDSSFTDAPIPHEHMREWLDQTVTRIESLQPKALLEIGCGVGLLVERLAPNVPVYQATDLSPRAVADLGRWIDAQPVFAHVNLQQREAVDLSGLTEVAFDTIVLNSVAQYFPDLDYFIAVLRDGARLLEQGGRFFVGDLRHSAHVPMFHAAIQLFKAAPQTTARSLLEQIKRALLHEKELAIDSSFFTRGVKALGFTRASIALKRGCFDNELTRYRYDVILSNECELPPPEKVIQWPDWSDTLDAFGQMYLTTDRNFIGVRGVKNRRMARDLAAWQRLQEAEPHMTAGTLRVELETLVPQGEDPESFWQLADRYGYEAKIYWTEGADDGRFDVDFLPIGISALAGLVAREISQAVWCEDLYRLATDPALGRAIANLGPELRDGLLKKLPAHMVPSSFTMLERMPLTANGKLDTRALPAPGHTVREDYAAPRDEYERLLAKLWSALLGVERIGRDYNFFELGGHSLLATQLVSRVRAETGVTLPLRTIFERPVLHDLAAWLALNAHKPTSEEVSASLTPIPRQPMIALSPMQHRLWVVDQLADPAARAAYNMPAMLRLEGRLDAQVLSAAVDYLVQRHQVLRTVYPDNEEGEPVAVIDSAAIPALDYSDIAQLPADAHESHIHEAMVKLSATPFDLAHGPLLRVLLLRTNETSHVLLFCVHHIIFDGWSTAVFTRELSAIYGALREGREPALQPLSVQYADYAHWHAAHLRTHAGANETFWQAYLKDARLGTTLPADPQTIGSAVDAGQLTGVLPPAMMDGINALARRAGTSDYVVLLGTFFLALHQAAGLDDAVIGTDVAGRSHMALEQLIGFFVNVVPLRSRLDREASFFTWLENLRDNVLGVFEHQDVPYDQIAEMVPRADSRQPLVRMLFVMQNLPDSRFHLPGLDIEIAAQAPSHAKFDLALFLRPGTDGIAVEWIYKTSLYRPETIVTLSAEWLKTVTRVLADPDQPIKSLGNFTNEGSAMQQQPSASAGKLGKLGSLMKKAMPVSPSRNGSVRINPLREDRLLPVMIEAEASNIDADSWAREQRDLIESLLCKHGGILFRNFGLTTPQTFERFAEAMEPNLHGCYGDLPKKEGGRNIYRSTPYPERQMILFHNESSHTGRWPRKQWFFCELAAKVGGITPIVDCRELLRKLPTDVAEEMESKELLYIRTFHPGLDVSWQHFFKTEDRAEVEGRLRVEGIEWDWLDGSMLQTRTRAPAVITHPLTGERSFFNQLQLHHVGCLEPEVYEALLAVAGPERMPRQVRYGDGSPIPDATMTMIGALYEQCAVRFPWRQGDVIMLDNMLAAHARDPFEGERKVVVAMGQMYDRDMLEGAKPVALPLEQDIKAALNAQPGGTL